MLQAMKFSCKIRKNTEQCLLIRLFHLLWMEVEKLSPAPRQSCPRSGVQPLPVGAQAKNFQLPP